MEDILGYSPDELVGQKHFYDLFAPEAREELKEAALAAFDRKESIRKLINPNVHKDGRIVILETSGSPVLDEKGRLLGYRGADTDITERKHAEKALRESERQKQAILDGITTNIAFVNEDLEIKWVNKTAADSVGKLPSQITGHRCHEFWANPDKPCDGCPTVKAFETKKSEHTTVVTPDGRVWDEKGDPVFDDAGRLMGVVEIAQDITDRKRAEDALRGSEDRYRDLVENIEDLICTHDLQGNLLFVNEAPAKVLGYRSADLIGTNLRSYLAPEERHQFDEYLATIQSDGHASGLMLVQTKSGDKRLWEYRNTLRTEGPGGPFVRGLARDVTDREKAEAAIRQQHDFLQQLIDTIPIPIFYKDVEGRYLGCNRAFESDTGMSRADIVGKTVFEVGPPDLAQIYHEQDLSLLRNPGVQQGETSRLDAAGNRHEVMFTKATFWDFEGNIAGLAGVILDITERKRAEQALRDSEQLLKGILSTSPVGISFTHDRKIKWVNEAWLKMLGFDDEQECVGQDTRILYPSEEEYRRIGKAIYTDLESQEVTKTDVTFKRKDGSVFDAHLRMKLLDPSSPDKGSVAAVADISAWKKAEQALRASETRYRRLFEAAKDGILILDADTAQIVDVNPFLTDLLGYSREEFLERKIWEIGIFEDIQKCRALFVELQRKKYVRYEDLPLQKKDGSGVEVEFVSNVYQVNSNKVIQCNIRDITDRKRLERQLLQSQKMEAVGILAGGVAHDFNNLLTVVQGFSELLLMEMDQKAPGYSDLLKIHEAGLKGAELVRNLLAFSRKAETKPRPINLNHEVMKIEKLLSRTIPKMVKIELHLEGDLAAVNADPDQMGQVLMNLAVNAEQAMPDGGNLTIATANVSLDERSCRSCRGITQPGDYVLLTVSDTGHGMNEKTLEHIFEPFFTTKGVGKGTGLGLAMVYGIVRQHGGHITCDSQPNEGSTFKIYLPAIEKARIEKEDREEKALPRGGTETILLVDDEGFVRELGTKFLTRVGYTGTHCCKWARGCTVVP